MKRILSNADRRWNNTCREQAAKYLDMAKRFKKLGHKDTALAAMRAYHRCIADIRK